MLLVITPGLLAQEESAPTPRIAIKIPLGQTLSLDGMTIEFIEVLEDSRCPEDVVCVWAGQAKVKVRVSKDGVAQDAQELIVGKSGKNHIAQFDESTLKAIALSPYPTTKNTGARDYVLLVIKEKLEDQ